MIKNQKGQILIEVLLAVVILGTALVALLYGLSNSVLAVNTIANDRTAMNLARSQMEYVQAQSFDIADDGINLNVHYLKLLQRSRPVDSSSGDIDIEVNEDKDGNDIDPGSDYLQLIRVTVRYVDSDAVLEDYKPKHQELDYAIFAGEQDETGDITVAGDGLQIQGKVHANGKPGDPGSVTLTKGDKEYKEYTVNGDVTAFDSAPDIPPDDIAIDDDITLWGDVEEVSESKEPPITYRPSPTGAYGYDEVVNQFGYPDFDFSEEGPLHSHVVGTTVKLNDVPDVWEDWPDNTQLKPGIYYFPDDQANDTEKIVLSCSPFYDEDDEERIITISGRVTFIAEAIEIRASVHPDDPDIILPNNIILSPYIRGILAFALPVPKGDDDAGLIKITANNSIFGGALYSPDGKIQLIGEIISGEVTAVQDDTFAGMLVAEVVEVYGEDSSFGF